MQPAVHAKEMGNLRNAATHGILGDRQVFQAESQFVPRLRTYQLVAGALHDEANGACRFFDAQSGRLLSEEFDGPSACSVGGKLWLAAAQQRGFAAACGAGDQRKRSFFDFRAKGPDKGAPVLVRLCGEAFCWQLCFSGGLVREREIVEC